MDTLFGEADRNFHMQQVENIRSEYWISAPKGAHLEKDESTRDHYKYWFSIPLFSLDFNYVVVYESLSCGSLCGYRAYMVYHRIGEREWEEYKTLHAIAY